MNEKDTVAYQYWFSRLQGFGVTKQEIMIKQFGSAYNIYKATEKELKSIENIRPADIDRLLENRKSWDLQGEWDSFSKRGIKFVTLEMNEYPSRLRNIFRAPYSLYIRGKLPPEEKLSIAIVGARICSEYGRRMAYDIAGELAKNDAVIISGMAKGIDSAAHHGTIAHQKETYAILGCGVDICYPAENNRLYQDIWRTGGIISEYPPGVEPISGLFPERNRIISGLSDIIIVIEARKRSGSLITADIALEQGRSVYALPGRVTDTLSQGCNRLIQQGAGIVLSAKDLLEEVGIFNGKMLDMGKNRKLLLEKEEWLVYSCLDLQPKSFEQILEESGCSIEQLIEGLVALQKKGCIKEVFKNYYICN